MIVFLMGCWTQQTELKGNRKSLLQCFFECLSLATKQQQSSPSRVDMQGDFLKDIHYAKNTYCQEQLLLVIVMPMGTASFSYSSSKVSELFWEQRSDPRSLSSAGHTISISFTSAVLR